MINDIPPRATLRLRLLYRQRMRRIWQGVGVIVVSLLVGAVLAWVNI